MRHFLAVLGILALTACTSAFANIGVKDHVNTVLSIDNNSCTATFIGPKLALTAAHCVRDVAEPVDLTLYNGKTLIGRVYKKNEEADTALITIDNVGEFPYNPLRCDKAPVQGELISMVGFPAGLPWMFTRGFVAGFADKYIILDIRGWFGSSGSAVLDADGKIIGLVSVAVNDPSRGTYGIFVGAVSIQTACKMING